MFSRQLQQVYLYGSKLSSPYHNSGEIPSVADNFRQKINDDDRQAMSALSTIREQLQDTKKTAEEFLRGADDIKQYVLAVGEELKRAIDRRMNSILTELETVTSGSARQAEYVKESYQLSMVSLEIWHRDAQALLEKGPLDVTQGAGELHNRAVELLNNDVTAVKYSPYDLDFTPGNIAGHMAYVKDMDIGQLSVKAEKQTGMSCLLVYIIRLTNTSKHQNRFRPGLRP